MTTFDYLTCQQAQIPILAPMGFTLEQFDGETVIARMPHTANKNDKNTGFAGSLYSGMVYASWLLVKGYLHQQSLDLDLAVVKSETEYLGPTTDDFLVTSRTATADGQTAFIDKLNNKGKGSIQVVAEVTQGDCLCCRFLATYVAFPNPAA